MDEAWDAIVVGAGPAGAVTARLLAQWGLRILLTERLSEPRWRPTEMLAPASLPLLHALDLVRSLADADSGARAALGIRRTWGQESEVIDDFLRHPGGSGYLVDRHRFDLMLRLHALRAGANLQLGTSVLHATRSGEGWRVELLRCGRPTRVRARFLVDATGRPALLARRLGAKRKVADSLVASIEHVPVEQSRQRWLTIETNARGWRYDSGNGMAVAIDDGRTAARRHGAFDASSACLDSAAGEGWIAVGDAACAFDPIAGQGLAQALGSARAGAEVVRRFLEGTPGALEEYARQVQATWLHSETIRHSVYAAEQRWIDAPFWRRRHAQASCFTDGGGKQ